MGQVRGRVRLLVALAYVVLHPLLAYLEQGPLYEQAPAVTLTAGLLVVLLLSLGPVGAVLAVVVRCGVVALGGGGADAVLAELVATVAYLPATTWMEYASVRRQRTRTDGVVAEFVLLAVVLAPALATLGSAAILGVPWSVHQAMGAATGVAALVPGLRILLHGGGPRLDAVTRRTLVVWGVALAAVVVIVSLLVVGDPFGSVPVLALLLVVAATRLGFASLTVLVAVVTLLVHAGLAVVGTDVGGLPVGAHAGLLAVILVGLFVSVETDRRAEAADELDVLFRRNPQPAAVVELPGLGLVRPNPLLAELLGGGGPHGRPRSAFVDMLAEGADGVGALAPLVDGEVDEVEADVWFRDRSGRWRFGQLSASRLERDGPIGDQALVQITDLGEVHERTVALERANTALNRLSGRIAHDLRQPLSAIVGYASTIDEHVDRLPPDLLRDMSARLSAAATRAAERLESLAEAARHAGDGPQPVDLGQTLDHVGETFSLDVGGQLASMQRRLDVEEVVGDPGAISTILLNLVGNSLKYARPGTWPRIRVSSHETSTGWRITVEDEGLGIPVADLDRVFARGSRLDVVDVPGSGTGLTDSRDLAEAGGGWLEALPSVDGARFDLLLPRPDPGDRAGQDGPPLRVLHLEGTRALRVRLRSMLELDDDIRHVGDVAAVRDVVQAVRAVRPDVVVVGTGVDGEDLRPAVAVARGEHPSLRVVHAQGDPALVLKDLAGLVASRVEPQPRHVRERS